MDAGPLKGKVTILTGGANGIGAVATESFASEGAKALFMDVDHDGGAELERRLAEKGYDVTFLYGDVGHDLDVQNAVALAQEKHGRLDVIYNNASDESAQSRWHNNGRRAAHLGKGTQHQSQEHLSFL